MFFIGFIFKISVKSGDAFLCFKIVLGYAWKIGGIPIVIAMPLYFYALTLPPTNVWPDLTWFSKFLPISWHFRPDACLPPPQDTDLRKSLPLLNFLKYSHSPLVFWSYENDFFVCLFYFFFYKKKRKTLNFIFRKRKKYETISCV